MNKITKNKSLLLLVLTILITISIYSVSAEFCYQESANVSNQTGIDGNCGLNYSGKYKIDIPSDSVYFYINYSYPITANLSSYIRIKYDDIKNNNFTIPASCYYRNVTQFLFRTDIGCDGHTICSNVYCKNSTGWQFFNGSYSFSDSGSSYNPAGDSELFYPFDGNWNTYLTGYYGTVQYPCSGGNCAGNLYEEGVYWNVCINNWILNSTSCNGIIQNYTKNYYDAGNCNNAYNLPIDNGTFYNCCIENFTTTTISCDGIMNQTITNYTDMNSCNTTFTRPANYGNVTACCVENFIQNDTACNLYNYTIKYYDNRSCGTYYTLPIDNNVSVDCRCISNWVQDATPCLNNVYLKSYTDLTGCGNLTVILMPVDNSTYSSCVIHTQSMYAEDIIILAILFLFILVCTICAIAVHESFFGIDALLILCMLYVFWHYNYPQILWYVTPFMALAFLIMWVALWKVRRG